MDPGITRSHGHALGRQEEQGFALPFTGPLAFGTDEVAMTTLGWTGAQERLDAAEQLFCRP